MADILIIDDDPDILALTRSFLEREGHSIRAESDGRAGLKAFRAQGADLVLTDIFMPQEDGLEVIKNLRTLQPTLPIVAMSGGGRIVSVGAAALKAAKKTGAALTLKKPFTQDELVEAVGRALAAAPKS